MIQDLDDCALVSGISLYADNTERNRHIGNIILIAYEIGCSVSDVTRRYEDILAELKPRAHIFDYLGAFATRKVRVLLKNS